MPKAAVVAFVALEGVGADAVVMTGGLVAEAGAGFVAALEEAEIGPVIIADVNGGVVAEIVLCKRTFAVEATNVEALEGAEAAAVILVSEGVVAEVPAVAVAALERAGTAAVIIADVGGGVVAGDDAVVGAALEVA